ncbi:MAG: hypothetical protein KBD21_02310 [Candidatus Pacebacteria bacterium]|nr:hypothetical protein [Candidatus Paceibacterota bacterium]
MNVLNVSIPEHPKLKVRINRAAEVIWEGEAESVSSSNANGAFDILPYHINFITYLENDKVTVRENSQTHSFDFKQAVLYVENNILHVYADI